MLTSRPDICLRRAKPTTAAAFRSVPTAQRHQVEAGRTKSHVLGAHGTTTHTSVVGVVGRGGGAAVRVGQRALGREG